MFDLVVAVLIGVFVAVAVLGHVLVVTALLARPGDAKRTRSRSPVASVASLVRR